MAKPFWELGSCVRQKKPICSLKLKTLAKGISNKIYNSFAPLKPLWEAFLHFFKALQNILGNSGGMHATLLRHFAADIQLKDGETSSSVESFGGIEDERIEGCVSQCIAFACGAVALETPSFAGVSMRESWIGHAVTINRKWFFQPPKLWQNCQGNFGNPTKKRWVWAPRLKIASTNASRAEEATDWRSYDWKGINWASTNWAEQWKNRFFRVYRRLFYPDI